MAVLAKQRKTVYHNKVSYYNTQLSKMQPRGGGQPLKIPQFVQEILQKLQDDGKESYCVGGCVRDLMLGRVPEDWDVTTSALPEETMALFTPRAFPTGLRHGTVTVGNGHQSVEVTTFRRDGTYQDHRRPDTVQFTRSLEEDLARRDFTVNAIALGLDGVVHDPYGGIPDLKNGLLRCVGDPDCRFQEDALRIMRGLRFAATLGFSIEANTAAAIRKHKDLLAEIAVERIQVELWKLLTGKDAVRVLREFPEVIGVFWPEILPMVGFDQQNFHHIYDVWEHSLHAVDHVPPVAELRCAALLHDIGKPHCFTIDDNGLGHFYGHAAISKDLADVMLRRLKCSNEVRERIVRLVDWHDREIPRTDKSINRALRILGEEELRLLIKLKRADNLAQAPEFQGWQQELDKAELILNRLLDEDSCFSLKQLAVNGRDMMALGYQGPEIGKVLDRLLNQVIDGELQNQREILLTAAKK